MLGWKTGVVIRQNGEWWATGIIRWEKNLGLVCQHIARLAPSFGFEPAEAELDNVSVWGATRRLHDPDVVVIAKGAHHAVMIGLETPEAWPHRSLRVSVYSAATPSTNAVCARATAMPSRASPA